MFTLITARWRRFLKLAVGSGLLLVLSFAPVAAQQPAAAPVDKEVVLFGQKIHYQEAGSGPVVILLHGMGGNTSAWGFNVAALASKFRVIIPDQVGFGRSDKPLINYRIGTYVDFLDKLYQELKIERATLVGNSMGGWIAAAYTIEHPDRVERLVLVDAAGFSPPKDFDASILSDINPTTRASMKRLLALNFSNKQLFASDAAIDLALTARFAANDGFAIKCLVETILRNEDVLDNRLSAIKKPTLIIWGRDDGLLTLADFGERFHKEIAGSQLVVIEKAGHVPQVEQAAEFNTALLKFLAAPGP